MVRNMSGKTGFKLNTGHLFIGGALVLAVISALLFQSLLGGPSDDVQVQVVEPETKEIVLAKRPIPAGTLIRKDDLKTVDWPVDHYPDNLVFEDYKDLIGRSVRKDILTGEPIYRIKLAGENSQGGLPVIIPEGMRAITIHVTDIKGVAGFIKPGDHVDVLATVETQVEDTDVNLTKTVLQNVLVLAAEQEIVDEELAELKQQAEKAELDGEDAAKAKKKSKKSKKKGAKVAKNITLALWPGEVEKVFLADELGTLRMTLRNEDDFVISRASGVTSAELFNSIAERGLGIQVQEDKNYDYTVEYISGTQKNELKF